MTRTQQGQPRAAEVVSLLNDAYDGWGGEPYFRWKYELYPGYDPETQTFHSRLDGELAAFRRVFTKEVVDGEQTSSVFVLGDTAVAPGHQGEGLYSELHSETVDFGRQQDADLVSTFNRKTNVTFDANLGRGWQYRELPLKIRLLSPDVVLRQYTDLVVSELPAIETVADRLGRRLHIGTSNGPVSVRDCLSSEPPAGMSDRSVGPSVSDRTLAQLIDLACSDDPIEPLQTLLEGWLPLNGSPTAVERAERSTTQATAATYRTHCTHSVTTGEFEAIVGLYDAQTASFRRTPVDIRHILQYPNCDIVLVSRQGTCVGYAVVGPRLNGELLEGRVLELRVDYPAAFDPLIDEIERVAADRGYDIILLFTDRPMDELWASVDQQVLMWRQLDGASQPLVDNCTISLYDVV